MEKKRQWFRAVLLPAAVTVILLLFFAGLSNLSKGRGEEERQQLEEAVRRAAVACYAAEGIYPPDLNYLKEHYGIQVDEASYLVVYEPVGSNLMPVITVLEREP